MNSKLIGSSLIIAGTALGAGMLAIPMILSQFGLLWGTALMLFIFIGTTYAALLLLEASIYVEGGFGMNSIACKILGKGGQVVTNSFLYALLICILMAYISGAGDLLHKLLTDVGFNATMIQSQVAFTVIGGIIVALGTAIIDKLNRILFIVMIAMLIITLVFLFPGMSTENLGQASNSYIPELISHSSAIFTSFGFMVVLPSLVSYNKEATHKQLRNMVILGSSIPLVCYLVWFYAILGNLSAEELTHFSNVSELIAVFSQKYGFLDVVLSVFSWLALLTSFLGVSMALFTQNQDMLKQNKIVTYIVSFLLPLAGAIWAADQFLAILSYAGTILTVLAVFIPLSMVIKLRSKKSNSGIYRAEGGIMALILTTLFGFFLLFTQFYY